MDAAEFLGLEPTDEPHRWRLPVRPEITSGLGALFGGVGLGAAVEAMVQHTGRPLVWATAQYLSFARPPSVVDIEVVDAAVGHKTSQVRATGHVDDLEIFTVNAALGQRDFPAEGTWAERPDVPAPEDCPARPLDERMKGRLASRWEMRMAKGRFMDALPGPPGDGRIAFWARIPGLEVSYTSLAILGDMVPAGISQALGMRAGGNSLDNTIRVVHLVPTSWVLLDVRIHAVAHGFGHGLAHIWAEDGTLLATASQSAVVRGFREEPPRD
jgi:acyl-CoA thioesterase II